MRDTWIPAFLDDNTIMFFTNSNPDGSNPSGEQRAAIINTDGTGLRLLPGHVVLPGGSIVPNFSVFGRRRYAFVSPVSGTPVNGPPTAEVMEAFLNDGTRVLQLTNFGRSDTTNASLDNEGRRVLFLASADPLGSNPSENCQIFSIGVFGAGLRQLTHFSEGQPTVGCSTGPPPGCHVLFAQQDREMRTVLFESSCAPFGRRPPGNQIFAMRPDGSALRQLTHTRGARGEPDATFVVEMPGPFAYSGFQLGGPSAPGSAP